VDHEIPEVPPIPIKLQPHRTHEGKTILEEAQALVHGDRNMDYGSPYYDFARTGRQWGAILDLDRDVEPEEVALCMIALKVSRLAHAFKRDSAVDVCGYAETLVMVNAERVRLESGDAVS